MIRTVSPVLPKLNLVSIRSCLTAFTPPALPPPRRLIHQLWCHGQSCHSSWRQEALYRLARWPSHDQHKWTSHQRSSQVCPHLFSCHPGSPKLFFSMTLDHGHFLRHCTSMLRDHGRFPPCVSPHLATKPAVTTACTALLTRRLSRRDLGSGKPRSTLIVTTIAPLLRGCIDVLRTPHRRGSWEGQVAFTNKDLMQNNSQRSQHKNSRKYTLHTPRPRGEEECAKCDTPTAQDARGLQFIAAYIRYCAQGRIVSSTASFLQSPCPSFCYDPCPTVRTHLSNHPFGCEMPPAYPQTP